MISQMAKIGINKRADLGFAKRPLPVSGPSCPTKPDLAERVTVHASVLSRK